MATRIKWLTWLLHSSLLPAEEVEEVVVTTGGFCVVVTPGGTVVDPVLPPPIKVPVQLPRGGDEIPVIGSGAMVARVSKGGGCRAATSASKSWNEVSGLKLANALVRYERKLRQESCCKAHARRSEDACFATLPRNIYGSKVLTLSVANVDS